MGKHSAFQRGRAFELMRDGLGRLSVCRKLSLSPNTLKEWIAEAGGAARVRALGAAALKPDAVPAPASPVPSPVALAPPAVEAAGSGADGGRGEASESGPVGDAAAALAAAGPEPVPVGGVLPLGERGGGGVPPPVATVVPPAPPPPPAPVVPPEDIIVVNIERGLSMLVRAYAAVRRVPWSDDLARGAALSDTERAELRGAAVHVAEDFRRLVEDSGRVGKVYFYVVLFGVVFGRVQGVNLRARALRPGAGGEGAAEGDGRDGG